MVKAKILRPKFQIKVAYKKKKTRIETKFGKNIRFESVLRHEWVLCSDAAEPTATGGSSAPAQLLAFVRPKPPLAAS